MSKIDHFTFKMLIDNLKSPDNESVADTINQLVKEKRPQAIPPVYFVSRMHASPWVRSKAIEGLQKLDPNGDIDKLTMKDGHDIEVKDAVAALIEEYGHYRS